MGKRKKAAKAPTKKKAEPLATVFPCLFCNHEKSVSCKLDKKGGVGHLSCKVCDQSFQCGVNYLSQPVDVYSEWVDACDQIAKETQEGPGGRPSAAHRNGRRDSEGELEGDFIEHDEDDHDADGVEDDDY